jgi:hypothetical protein
MASPSLTTTHRQSYLSSSPPSPLATGDNSSTQQVPPTRLVLPLPKSGWMGSPLTTTRPTATTTREINLSLLTSPTSRTQPSEDTDSASVTIRSHLRIMQIVSLRGIRVLGRTGISKGSIRAGIRSLIQMGRIQETTGMRRAGLGLGVLSVERLD